METSDFLIYGGIILIVIAGLVAAVSSSNIVNVGGDPKYKVQCTGTVKVSLFGAFNDPDLSPLPSCSVEKCGVISSSLSNLFLGEQGNIRLIVDGTVRDTQGFETSFSQDASFTLKSACIDKPSKATVELYNEKNLLVDTWSGALQ